MQNVQKTKAEEAVALVKKSIESCSTSFDGRTVVMFSGGRDSSAVSAAYCKAFPDSQLHLLFIDNGLLSRVDSTKRQANLLRDLFPGTEIVFETKRVSQMMRVAGMQEIEKDFKRYGFSTLLICVACKLIMNFSAARYAKEQGINFVLDGFANRQQDYPEQTDVFMEFVKDIFSQNDLNYLSPLYDFLTDKEQVNKTLSELGVYIPKQEPICMWANSFSTADKKEIANYLKKTADLIVEHDPVLKC